METLTPGVIVSRTMPDWVKRWLAARANKDFRLFPEQGEGIISLHWNHGYPVGPDKDIGYPSGYEREMRIIAQVPTSDARFWVQPDEYVPVTSDSSEKI